MTSLSRRTLLTGAASLSLAGCVSAGQQPATIAADTPVENAAGDIDPVFTEMYAAAPGERFPVPAVNLREVNKAYLRRVVSYQGRHPPGTIVVDPARRYLFLVEPGGRAIRYGVGVGREGFAWAGDATVNSKQEWPDWYPPKEMVEREPTLKAKLKQLQSGLGVAGGPGNPLGARALYLWQGNRDTLFRIHGTVEPWTIGRNVSSGCIRLINQDAIHLYERVPIGTRVTVLGGGRVA